MSMVGTSASRMVPTPWPSKAGSTPGAGSSTRALLVVTSPRLTKYCSVLSNTPSPKICTSMVADVAPAGIVSKPLVAP